MPKLRTATYSRDWYDYLISMCRKKGITITNLNAAICKPKHYFWYYVDAQMIPSKDVFKACAKVLGIKVSDIPFYSYSKEIISRTPKQTVQAEKCWACRYCGAAQGKYCAGLGSGGAAERDGENCNFYCSRKDNSAIPITNFELCLLQYFMNGDENTEEGADFFFENRRDAKYVGLWVEKAYQKDKTDNFTGERSLEGIMLFAIWHYNISAGRGATYDDFLRFFTTDISKNREVFINAKTTTVR